MSWLGSGNGIVAKLSIAGIRGVLDRGGDFELARDRSPGSIALYAPSACGKSSYADAVEYLFSEDGRVAHLGKSELPHVLTEERGIKPQVSVTLVDSESGESIQITRLVRMGRVDNMPPELLPIVRAAPAHRVLRQHDLRHFVVAMTPGAKYAELSRWFGLTRLEEILEHLEITSNVLESRDFEREVEERVQDIARHTNHAVTEHDERAVLDWCEAEAERHLGTSLAIDSLQGMKKAIRTLKQLQGRIILASGVAELYQAKLTLEQIATDLTSQACPEPCPERGRRGSRRDGQLQLCHTTLTAAVAAERHAASLFTVSKHGVFQEVWEAASGVLESRLTDECPVCRTPWVRSHIGSQEGALISLTSRRNELTELVAARSEQQKATRELETAIRGLEARLAKISAQAAKLSLSEVETQATELVEAARALSTTDRFPSQLQGECEELLSRCRQFVVTRLRPALQSLHISKVPATDQVQATIAHFQALWDALVRLKELRREREEYRNIKRDFNVVADVIRERAATTINEVVAALRDDVQSIYQMIHPTDAVPNIHIVPDAESKTLTVQVDFHSRGLPPSDRPVPPAGYLSESQISTLGLALFISSVGLFNRRFPFLFLDDVVSSYDAEHKERIVDLIAERLGGFQVFLTTHDLRFYSMLKDRLHDKGWLFERVSGWDFEHGPRREVDAL